MERAVLNQFLAVSLCEVLLEAMALGTPCISTDVSGIPEVLRDGETGLATPQHDPPSLARVCGQLLADPALRKRLAVAAGRPAASSAFAARARAAGPSERSTARSTSAAQVSGSPASAAAAAQAISPSARNA